MRLDNFDVLSAFWWTMAEGFDKRCRVSWIQMLAVRVVRRRGRKENALGIHLAKSRPGRSKVPDPRNPKESHD